MKSWLPLAVLLFTAGCPSDSQPARHDEPNKERPTSENTETAGLAYTVLTSPPDALLDEMDWTYWGDNKQWRKDWKYDNSSIPIDGQRALRLLELACYADIVCHRIEYPLRVATLDYVKENLSAPGVSEALHWIRTSYQSGLPLEEPGDTNGDFTGMRVHAMKRRLTEYAIELLR